jgi:hypothetical protein
MVFNKWHFAPYATLDMIGAYASSSGCCDSCLKMRSDSRLAGYVISSVLEPPKDNFSEQEGSLTGSITAKDSAASSLVKGPASKGPPKTADFRRGQVSVAVCGHTSAHVAGVAGNPRIQWDVI